MGKFSQRLLKYWLSIPRWFKVFILSAVTIYMIWALFIEGVRTLLDFHLDLAELIICAIAAAVILFIFTRKKRVKLLQRSFVKFTREVILVMIRYFSDNFFSAGVTEIYNENKEMTGYLDLKNVFTSTLSVMDTEQQELVKGKMGFFAHWTVSDANDNKLGVLKQKFSFFSKKYQYTDSNGELKYSIESEALSKEYEIFDDKGTLAAKFERVSHFFSSPAYKLHVINDSYLEEMIAIVMGVGKMQNQNAAAASSSTT